MSFQNVLVVGMHFRGAEAVEIASALQPGNTLELEREPANAYDPFAIKVLYKGIFFGYIERGQAAWISPEIDEGKEFTCTVTGQQQKGRNLHPVVEIFESQAAA